MLIHRYSFKHVTVRVHYCIFKSSPIPFIKDARQIPKPRHFPLNGAL